MLGPEHRTDLFASGQPQLDRWLNEHALDSQARRTARTFVWHAGDTQVVAYYALAAHLLERDDLPTRLGRGGPRQTPAVLLARLALDRSLHGRRLGGALLADALARVIPATETVAAGFVVVDAIDDAAARFYEHHGFRTIPNTRRPIAKLTDLAAAILE